MKGLLDKAMSIPKFGRKFIVWAFGQEVMDALDETGHKHDDRLLHGISRRVANRMMVGDMVSNPVIPFIFPVGGWPLLKIYEIVPQSIKDLYWRYFAVLALMLLIPSCASSPPTRVIIPRAVAVVEQVAEPASRTEQAIRSTRQSIQNVELSVDKSSQAIDSLSKSLDEENLPQAKEKLKELEVVHNELSKKVKDSTSKALEAEKISEELSRIAKAKDKEVLEHIKRGEELEAHIETQIKEIDSLKDKKSNLIFYKKAFFWILGVCLFGVVIRALFSYLNINPLSILNR